MKYDPTGITAQARQSPLLNREPSDFAALNAAEEKRKRKAARNAKLASDHAPTNSSGKSFGGSEQRRLKMRARKL